MKKFKDKLNKILFQWSIFELSLREEEKDSMKNIAVIGAGTMGSGIAHCFAQHGYSVTLIDRSAAVLDRVKKSIENNLDRQCAKGILTAEEKGNALRRIQLATTIAAGVSNADIAIEAVVEDKAIKQQIFHEMDQHAPAHCILASNTSSLSISDLAAVTSRPDQFIGMHFMNPVPVMPLVEIIKGKHTSQVTLSTIQSLTEHIKKTPLVAADAPGFVANRILLPMINEAITTLHQGIADVYAIDHIMKLGMGHPMGPLRLADFIGLDVCLSILNVLHHGFGDDKYAPCPLLVKMVGAGTLGVKTKQGFYNYALDMKNPTPCDF